MDPWSKVLLCDDARGGYLLSLGVGCLVGRGLCVEGRVSVGGALLCREHVWWRATPLGKAGDECRPWSGGGCRLTNN